MFSFCDACRRPNPTELTQIQIERGEVVAGRSGNTLRPRSRDLFILCAECGNYALGILRHVIDSGGAPTRQAGAGEAASGA